MKSKMLKPLSKPSGKDYWEGIIRESQASNISNIEFCQQRRIAISAFYYWKKKILNGSEKNQPALIEVPNPLKNMNSIPNGNNDIISMNIDQDFRFNISMDLKTVLPLIQELFNKRK